MAETLTIPVASLEQATDSALVTHEVLDQAAHEQIADTKDEDYKWLTDRLDAQSAEIASLRMLCLSQYQEQSTLLQSNQEQSRLLIQSQSEMIANLLSSVTALSESALLKLTQTPLMNSLLVEEPIVEPEPIPVVVTESVPESQDQTREKSVDASGKKRRRM